MGKTTKGFLLGLTTAAAAIGAYYVYQNKEKIFKTEEVLNDDGSLKKKRTYVDLDNIKAKTNEAVNKTKETAQDNWKKVTDKFDKKKKEVVSEAEEIIDEAEVIDADIVDAEIKDAEV